MPVLRSLQTTAVIKLWQTPGNGFYTGSGNVSIIDLKFDKPIIKLSAYACGNYLAHLMSDHISLCY